MNAMIIQNTKFQTITLHAKTGAACIFDVFGNTATYPPPSKNYQIEERMAFLLAEAEKRDKSCIYADFK